MVEHIVKIRVEELKTIRLCFSKGEHSGEIHEIPLVGANAYASMTSETGRHLRALLESLAYFSKKDTDPSLEFALPAKGEWSQSSPEE